MFAFQLQSNPSKLQQKMQKMGEKILKTNNKRIDTAKKGAADAIQNREHSIILK